MARFKILETDPPSDARLLVFWCPGCEQTHPFDLRRWAWDGNLEEPTLRPSLRVLGDGRKTTCHLFLRGGRISYCADSPHALAGKTVEAPELPV